MYYMEQVQALCWYEEKWVTEDCAKAKYHTLSSKLTIHWDIKALVFLVTDDLDRCFFLHSSPVWNNSSSGLASLCPGSEHHLLTSSDISFQTVLLMNFLLICPVPVKSLHVQFKSMLRCTSPCSFPWFHFAFEPVASFLLCSPCRFHFTGLLIAPCLFLEVLTPAPTGWRPSVCRSDRTAALAVTTGSGTVWCLAVAAQPGSQLSHYLT